MLNWGIVSTGQMAKAFYKSFSHASEGKVVAVASRTIEGADAFCKELDADVRKYGTYDELIADDGIDIVYIATPHPFHAEWAIKAAENGKHVLCEKPFTMNKAEAMAVVDAARRNNVFLMEAFMYRCHPQIEYLLSTLKSGVIGRVCSVNTSIGFAEPLDQESRLLRKDLGGGAILDLGCYNMSFVRMIVKAEMGNPNPSEVKGFCQKGKTEVDEQTIASMIFPDGMLAQVACGFKVNQDCIATILGTKGEIVMSSPWGFDNTTSMTVSVGEDSESKDFGGDLEIDGWDPVGLYGLEIDHVEQCIKDGKVEGHVSWEDSIGNMRALDAWRESIELSYDMEVPENASPPIVGRPLRSKGLSDTMLYGNVPGIDKPVSRIVLGEQFEEPTAFVMYDHFYEYGGNCIDTAWMYGEPSGRAEEVLGLWMESRGIRDEIIVLDKGAHTPYCDPVSLSEQIDVGLNRLRTDYIDMYVLHRDNPDVSVSEFMDVLARHKAAGKLKAYGVSNWDLPRVVAANAYADSKGIDRLSVVSNQFSLAQWSEAPWEDSYAASSQEFRDWFDQTGTALFSWSSLAQGFFSSNPLAWYPTDWIVNCWFTADNLEKRNRAQQLADRKGVSLTQIALAYVLNQSFSTFPIVGACSVNEIRLAAETCSISMSAEDVAFLDCTD